MRILGIGDTFDLGSMYMHLGARGHEVRVFASDPAAHDTLLGLVERVDRWEAQLDWVRGGGKNGRAGGASDGLIVFETAHHGQLQQSLRADGFQVIGGNSYGDRLENDRAFGQQVMRDVGMSVVKTHAFDDFAAATAFVRAHPGRYVYKPSGGGFACGRTFVGEMNSGADMLAYLALQEQRWPAGEPVGLVLMERVQGVEVGVGGYFNGRQFLRPTCLDWEHKRFFPGDLGELTGEMGTLVSYRRGERLFEETLGRMEEPLRASGYCGYINVNAIVTEDGVHPLEFTCRFGYPGFAILQPLQLCGWDEIFQRMLLPGSPTEFPTRDGFAVGVVLTVPPFPYSAGYEDLSKGLPVLFDETLTDADREQLHFAEVAERGGQLLTSGMVGYIMVVTGCGDTAALARDDAYGRVAKIYLPNRRYRGDIAQRFISSDEARLRSLGWL